MINPILQTALETALEAGLYSLGHPLGERIYAEDTSLAAEVDSSGPSVLWSDAQFSILAGEAPGFRRRAIFGNIGIEYTLYTDEKNLPQVESVIDQIIKSENFILEKLNFFLLRRDEQSANVNYGIAFYRSLELTNVERILLNGGIVFVEDYSHSDIGEHSEYSSYRGPIEKLYEELNNKIVPPIEIYKAVINFLKDIIQS